MMPGKEIDEIVKLRNRISKNVKSGSSTDRLKDMQDDNESFHRLFNKMPDAVIILDRKGTLLEANETAKKLSGCRKSEMLGRNMPASSIMGIRNKKLVLEKLALHFSGEEVPPFGIGIHKKDGNIVPIEVSLQIIDYKGKKAELVVLRDITERKKVGQIANEAREYAESIEETVREPLIVLDAGLRVISANKSFYRSFKVNPKETKGQLIYDLGNRQWNIPALRKLLEEILPNNTSFDNYEVEHDFPHIGKRIMLLNARRIPRPPAKPRIMLLAIEDITERKKVEEETLREEGEKWISLMKNTDDVIMIVNGQGIIQYINRTIPPYSPEETIGKSVYEYVIKEQRNIMSESLKKVFKTGKPDRYEISSNIPKIGTMWFSTKLVPIKQDKVVVKKVIMISTDITERKRADDALRESEKRFRNLADSISDVFFATDKDLRYTYWNRASEKLTGIKVKDAIGKSISEIFPDREDTRKAIAMYRKALKTQQPQNFVNEYQLKGENFFFEINAYPSGDCLSVFVKDITERKKAEEVLRSSEEKFRAIFDNANDGMLLADVNTKKFYVGNNTMCQMLGYSLEEIKKLGVTDIHPKEDLPHVLGEFEKQARREIAVAKDLPVKRKDGSVFYADVNSSLVTFAGRKNILGIFRDVTERKKMEEDLRKRTEELERFNRLAVGRELKMIELKKRIQELENKVRDK